MANITNYYKELEKRIDFWRQASVTPSVLLHSCCAPCSSACLEYLTRYCRVTVFFYNPNITSKDEYEYRLEEQKRLIALMPFENPVEIIEGAYEPEVFYELANGLENAPERGPRCFKCYSLRLSRTAELAAEKGFDFFATTLTLSPLKPAEVINQIGIGLSPDAEASMDTAKYEPGRGIYLPTDFKKNNGYKRSIELSREYELYRQNYCGCIYSKQQSECRL